MSEPEGTATTETPAAPGAASNTHPVARDANLELLMDVELDVTLRFGQRQMLLEEILKLAPGSVIELDRTVDEPVEVLVGRKVVARGEIVVVDGNYGVRVTEIISPVERMESLRH